LSTCRITTRSTSCTTRKRFRSGLPALGPNTLAVPAISKSRRRRRARIQILRQLMKLADRYRHLRLENACARSLVYTTTPNIKTINTVLRTGHDKIEQQAAATESDPGSRLDSPEAQHILGVRRMINQSTIDTMPWRHGSCAERT
jgi:hypothetical protein